MADVDTPIPEEIVTPEPPETTTDDRPLIIENAPNPLSNIEPQESNIDVRPSIIEPQTSNLNPAETPTPQESNINLPKSTQPNIEPQTSNIDSPALPPQPSVEPPLPSPVTATFDVAQLTDNQLKAAAALYAKKNQSVLSRKGVEARQATAQKNISDILAFITAHSPASNRTIARALNLPPRRVQHYMQLLTHRGSVTATGWAASRQYYIK